MEDIFKILLIAVGMLAAMLLFTPYESLLEGTVAVAMVASVLVVFLCIRAEKCSTCVPRYIVRSGAGLPSTTI